MDFSYPPEVEQFRKELRAWLAANLSQEVVAAGRGRDPDTFETLRAWDATLADAGWGAVSWPLEYGAAGQPCSSSSPTRRKPHARERQCRST